MICSHTVVELHIDDSVTLKQVLDVKEAMKRHLHEIHNMQSVVIDFEEEHSHVCNKQKNNK